MEPLSSVYPDFVPNQILTSTQLNQLREYLDDQTRRSRVRLGGTGIACGLGVGRQGLVVEVDAGFGVTSAGYLVDMAATTYDHARPYVDPDHDPQGTPNYRAWQNSGDLVGQLDLYELLDSTNWPDGEQPSDARRLTAGRLDGQVVAIYLQRTSEKIDSCLVTDCDNEGRNVKLEPRVLLVAKRDLAAFDACAGHHRPRSLAVARLHTKLPLPDVSDGGELDRAFGELARSAAGDLVKALSSAFVRYGRYLDLDVDPAGAVAEAIEQALTDEVLSQYTYDLVKDFVAAYEEMAAAACELVGDCEPADDHPAHLLLGALDGTEGYRHRWIRSPVRDVEDGDRRRVRDLFRRIGAMAEAAIAARDDGPLGAVVLTPSHTEHLPLGHRAIPGYYARTAKLVELWHPSTCCTARRLWVPAIDADYTRSTFVRVDGHLGMGCDAAAAEIERLRGEHNVEFELVSVEIESDEDDDGDEVEAALETLAAGASGWAEFWTRVRKRFTPTGPLDLTGELRTRLRRLGKAGDDDLVESWRDDRQQRPLLCDPSHLEVDYLIERAELLCGLSAVDRLLADLPESALAEPPDGAEEASSYDWVSLLIGAVRLRSSARGLLHELPKELSRFNAATFGARHALMAADLAAVAVQVSRMTVRTDDAGGPWVRVVDDVRAAVDGLVGRLVCCRPAFEAIDLAYRQLREHGAAVLARYAERAPGLEHLAGVEPGGTFVLVCEDDAVVADFSLAGRVACCCRSEVPELCLPPAARPDTVVIDVRVDPEEGMVEGPVSVLVDVAADDRDHDDPLTARLDVSLESETSELGGRVEIVDDAVVRYAIDQPIPGTVDRFIYVVEGRCGRRRGTALVYLRPDLPPPPEPAPAPAPEPAPERTGTIVGRILNNGEPSAGTVNLDDGPDVDVDVDGVFRFEDVEIGREHTVTALASGRRNPKTRTVFVPDVRPVDASISFGDGGSGVRLVIPGDISLTEDFVLDVAPGPRRVPITNVVVDETGTFEIADLVPGTYWIRDREGRLPATPVEVVDDMARLEIDLSGGG